jgi:hypothetical protein
MIAIEQRMSALQSPGSHRAAQSLPIIFLVGSSDPVLRSCRREPCFCSPCAQLGFAFTVPLLAVRRNHPSTLCVSSVWPVVG